MLYRDIRTYGFRETYYKQAREAGVRLHPLRRRKRRRRSATTDGLVVTLKSPDLPNRSQIEADQLVLSTGIEADRTNNKRVSDMLKVPLNADGFLWKPT